MTQLTQLLVQGISTGAIFGLVPLGFVLSYKTTEVLNFAQGDVVILSAFLGWGLIVAAGSPFWLKFLVVLGISAALCFLLEAKIMRRIVGRPQFSAVMLTIGIGFMIRGGVGMVFGPESRSYPTPRTGQSTQIGGSIVAELNLVIVGAAMGVTALLHYFLRRTTLGFAIHAISQNQLAAYLCGVRVERLNSLVWAISGAIAGLCGLLLAPITLVDLGLWFVMLKALARHASSRARWIPGMKNSRRRCA